MLTSAKKISIKVKLESKEKLIVFAMKSPESSTGGNFLIIKFIIIFSFPKEAKKEETLLYKRHEREELQVWGL